LLDAFALAQASVLEGRAAHALTTLVAVSNG
jgi:hypothetical protein